MRCLCASAAGRLEFLFRRAHLLINGSQSSREMQDGSLTYARTTAADPGCVKTCASRGSAELFSPFASFEGCSPALPSLNQPNRDEKFYAQVRRRSFHTAGSFAHVAASSWRCL